ncbi:MAG: HAD family hydrolase [Terriglobales bacterium]|jgi:HAD superfamily hydrolase (TIGR01509 family)
MFKAIIFDLDGVIVDSHPLHTEAWKRFLSSRGIIAADEELALVRSGENKEEILRHFIGDLSEHQLRAYGEQKDRFYREKVRELKTVKGVRQLLKQLKHAGVPCAVASSGSFRRVHETLDLLRLRGCFATVATAAEFKMGKCDPAIFLRSAQWMRVRCEECLVFEDSVIGVRSATAIRMKCVGIADPVRGRALLEAGAEVVFPNFAHVTVSDLNALYTTALQGTRDLHLQASSMRAG